MTFQWKAQYVLGRFTVIYRKECDECKWLESKDYIHHAAPNDFRKLSEAWLCEVCVGVKKLGLPISMRRERQE